MSDGHKFGQTYVQRVNILPDLTLDMLDGKPTPPELGKTHTPVHVLPQLSFDMLARADDPSPILQLLISFRPNATPAQIGRDYHRLFAILNKPDLAEGGTGISPIEPPRNIPAEATDVQLGFRLSNPPDSERQVSEMIHSIESATNGLESIRECKARIAA